MEGTPRDHPAGLGGSEPLRTLLGAPCHLQEGPCRLPALLLQLLEAAVEPGDLLGEAGGVLLLHGGDVALQVTQAGQEVTGELLQGQAQPLELRQHPLPLGLRLLLRGDTGGVKAPP